MRALLNTLGASVWGLTAIILAGAVATIGYRLTLNHPADVAGDSGAPVSFQGVRPGASASQAGPKAARLPATPGGRRDTRSFPPARTARGSAYEWADTTVEQPEQLVPSASTDDESLIGHFVRPPSLPTARAQEISRIIALEMRAAQRALQAHQWQEAVQNLEAALTKSGLTSFDEKTIHYMLGFANVKLNNLKVAQAQFEEALATGEATPEESAQMTKALFAISASTNQLQKAIDYGKQVVAAGAAMTENQLIISQSYYQLKDCKDAVIWADKGIAAARKAGETPKENFFLFKLQCASDSQDNSAMGPVLIDLIKLNNKTTYWNSLLRIERQDERDDHNTLMIYRIMYNTQSMREDTDYIEMAQLLSDAALPGEAAAVLNNAMSSGVIKGEHKERTQRLLTSLQTRADADEKGLTQLETEAARNPAGELSVKLGELYFGLGQYQRAADALMEGLRRGGVRSTQEAYVYLGLAQVRLDDYADARDAFAMLAHVPGVSSRLFKLWQLYAANLDAPANAQGTPSSAAAAALPPALGQSDIAAAPTSAWVEGRHYERVPQAHPTGLPPGKVLVTEFFSYASPACYHFEPDMRRLIENLPPGAVVDYVAPSWSKDWPTFQLAYVTAHALGVADLARAALFDAIWNEKGELAFLDDARSISVAPTIQDVARFYEMQGWAPATKFLQTSKSFSVEQESLRGERLVADYAIDRVPTIVVNGKYRLHVQSAGSPERLIELVNYLVRKEAIAIRPS
jgi:protein dithiol oxidoreductase (disulfide-forming)